MIRVDYPSLILIQVHALFNDFRNRKLFAEKINNMIAKI
jgi:hypothetical protein